MNRAEIIDTGDSKRKAVKIKIQAPAEKIFSLLSDPRKHRLFDGIEHQWYCQASGQ